MQVKLFLIRGLIAIAWAIAFATVADSLTTSAGVLLVLYPVIDMVASGIDARRQQGSARRLLVANAVVSAVAAAALAIAATGTAADVLAVFGVWALLAGLAQLVVALHRRAVFGKQWPMRLAGGFSSVLGLVYVLMAAGGNARLGGLAIYAATGGIDFIIEAWLLRRRSHQEAISSATSEPALTAVRS